MILLNTLILLILFTINTICETKIKFDMLQLFEIEHLKSENQLDGKFYKLTREYCKKNLTLNFGETLKNNEEIVIEIIFRLNFDPYERWSKPIDIQALSEMRVLFLFLDGFEELSGKMKVAIKDETSRDMHTFSYNMSCYSDSNWHKLKISFSNEFTKFWLNCNLVLEESIKKKHIILKFFEGHKKQSYSLFLGSALIRDSSQVDLNKYEIRKQTLSNNDNKIKDLCTELGYLNQNGESPFDLTSVFGETYRHINYISRNSITHFYRFNKSFEQNVRIPKSFTQMNQVGNFSFDIVFRHEGHIEGQMRLFQLHNYASKDIQSVNINSGKNIIYIWSLRDRYQHSRAKIIGTNVYDGNWHRIQIDFTIIQNEEQNTFKSDFSYTKRLQFYLDCDLIGEDNLPGPIPFYTVEQTGVFFKNNLVDFYTNFDVLSMEMKDNYKKVPCKKIS